MNIDTGELMSLEDLKEKMGFDAITDRVELEKRLNERGWEVVPDELQEAAEKELAGQKETEVDLKSNNELAKWAAERRKKRSQNWQKKKRKIAKESRKRNWAK